MIALFASLARAQDAPDEGLVTKLTGQATTAFGGLIEDASEGSAVPIGGTLCTRENSFATVRLAATAGTHHHDEVTLFSLTCVTIVRSEARPEGRASELSLNRGSLAVRSADSGGGAVAIGTTSGTTSGTDGGYRVSLEEGAARTEAVTGAVVVSGAGAEVQVPSGFGSRVRTGEAPSEPVALLLPTLDLSPSDGAVLLRPEFGWASVDRALGYRVEVSTDPEFTGLVVVDEVPKPEWLPDLLFLPFRVQGLWWRVAAFDRTGFVGLASDPHQIGLPVGVGP